ncbi:zinc finger protein 768-like isoform X8 [Colletes gigas]|uniref:zinc finger protein 768-like isoform X8 n=1 Tax=Colletes gigas TaxID=935657 RepID=UPI001C9A8487|nr:zinc finger protein 768-like isoform X8 [Colletes gigas]
MSSLDYLDLCRLCLVKDRVSVPIFDGEGDVRQIFLKIAACLPVKVAREDKLPKKICDDCVYKVELFYQFWNTTVNAEKQLLQWLGEVGMEGKQGYVTNVLNPNVMKQEQSTENRLDGSVMQQVSEHQNNMGIGMMDNIGLGIPMIISNTNQQQQITSVPMDTSSNSAQNVQAVPGPSSQTTHNQISQNQTSSTQQEEEEESSEDEENSDDECDGDEGLPVKEESEEDPNSRTIEPTTFVNVSLACDEAGPSGLQQQKIADMPEIPMPQTADGDPKSGTPTIAEKSSTLNPAQPLFVVCNGPFVGQEEVPIQIKDPPVSDDEDNYNPQCDLGYNYDDVKELKTEGKEAKKGINNLSLDGTDSCPLTVEPNDNVNSLVTEVKQIKEEPFTSPTVADLEPVTDPLTAQRTNTFVPIAVKIEKEVNVSNNVLTEQGGEQQQIETFPSIRLNGKLIRLKFANLQMPKKNLGSVQAKEKQVMRRKGHSFQEIPVVDTAVGDVEMVYENLRTMCPYCRNTYASMNVMDRHFRKFHKDHYRCKKCQYIYESQDLLDEHYKLHTNKPTLFQCTNCKKKYKRLWALKQHRIREHSIMEPEAICIEDDDGSKTYPCQHCENVYPMVSQLVAHERITHGIQERRRKDFRCGFCKKYFCSEESLRDHSKIHEQKYVCDDCGREFRAKYLVRLHIRKHTGEKPYQCKICFRRYAQSNALKMHKLTHTGERPYVCNVCGQSFTQRSSMMIHHRKHPGNHPIPPPVSLANLDSDKD